MPQKGRGGKRVGAPGQAYPNRTDMAQAPRAVPGQTYGTAGAQIQAQQAMPLPATPPPGAAPAPQRDPAAALPAITDPSMRPNEPLTTGLPTGPGAGPEALGGMTGGPDPLEEIRGLYAAYPSDDLRRLLDYMTSG